MSVEFDPGFANSATAALHQAATGDSGTFHHIDAIKARSLVEIAVEKGIEDAKSGLDPSSSESDFDNAIFSSLPNSDALRDTLNQVRDAATRLGQAALGAEGATSFDQALNSLDTSEGPGSEVLQKLSR